MCALSSLENPENYGCRFPISDIFAFGSRYIDEREFRRTFKTLIYNEERHLKKGLRFQCEVKLFHQNSLLG